MVTPALPFRLVLAGATGLLLLGGIVAAVNVDEGNRGSDEVGSDMAPVASGQETSTTLAPAIDVPTSLVAPAPDAVTSSTTAAAAAGTVRTGQATTTSTAKPKSRSSATPGPLVAPQVGAYQYDATTSSSGGAPSTSRVSITVEAAGAEGATTLQDISIPTDQLGPRTTIRSRVAWSSMGAIVRRSQAAGGDCTWQPPWPQYVGDLRPGREWTYSTRCTVTTPVQATIERRGSRRVTGSQTVDAAGGAVATWTVAVDETTTITTTLGVFTVQSVGTERLAPSLGVPLEKTESLSGTGIAPGTTSTLKLVSLP